MSFLSTTTGVAIVDTRSNAGTITLPLTSQIPNRYFQIKDLYGSFSSSPLTISTQYGETFEDGTTYKTLHDPFTFITLYAGYPGKWSQLNGTQTIQQTMSSLYVSSINVGSAFYKNFISTLQLGNLVSTPNLIDLISSPNLLSTTIGLQNYTNLSISSFSTALGFIQGGGITTEQLNSTIAGLGTYGYISTPGGGGGITTQELLSTVEGLGTYGYISTPGGGGGITTQELVSTTAGLELYTDVAISSFSTALGYIAGGGGGIANIPLFLSTGAVYTSSLLASSITVSSITVDNLIFGDGNGWAYFGAIQAVAVSTIQTNTNILYASSVNAGYFIGDGSLLSNVPGLNSNQLISTVEGLGTYGYISTPGGGGGISPQELLSTVEGLGTSGYISTPGGGITTQELLSTVEGLGTYGYISTPGGGIAVSELVSTTAGVELYTDVAISSFSTALGYIAGGGGGGIANIPLFLSTGAVYTSSLLASTISVSSITVENLIFGDGNGWAYFGAIQAVAISTIQANTSVMYASSVNAGYFIGDGSLLTNVAGGGDVTKLNLVSTVEGLGTYGYISTAGGGGGARQAIIQTITF